MRHTLICAFLHSSMSLLPKHCSRGELIPLEAGNIICCACKSAAYLLRIGFTYLHFCKLDALKSLVMKLMPRRKSVASTSTILMQLSIQGARKVLFLVEVELIDNRMRTHQRQTMHEHAAPDRTPRPSRPHKWPRPPATASAPHEAAPRQSARGDVSGPPPGSAPPAPARLPRHHSPAHLQPAVQHATSHLFINTSFSEMKDVREYQALLHCAIAPGHVEAAWQ